MVTLARFLAGILPAGFCREFSLAWGERQAFNFQPTQGFAEYTRVQLTAAGGRKEYWVLGTVRGNPVAYVNGEVISPGAGWELEGKNESGFVVHYQFTGKNWIKH